MDPYRHAKSLFEMQLHMLDRGYAASHERLGNAKTKAEWKEVQAIWAAMHEDSTFLSHCVESAWRAAKESANSASDVAGKAEVE